MRTILHRNYTFEDKDPVIYAMMYVVRQKEKLTNARAEAITGVTRWSSWFDGVTRKPRNDLVTQGMGALGYVRRDVQRNDGTIEVHFVKVRDFGDYAAEIKKQTEWLLKQGIKKKRTARKKGARGDGKGKN